jgi:hypothetical protein
MQRTFYAVFDKAADAEAAIAELQRTDTERNHCTVSGYHERLATGSGTKLPPHLEYSGAVLHRDHLEAGAELHGGESALRRGVVFGALIGGILGAIVAALAMGPLTGSVGAPASALLGGVLGAMFGALMGGVAMAGGADPKLEKLAHRLHDQQVIVTVEAPGATAEEDAEMIVRRHGGRTEHRLLA